MGEEFWSKAVPLGSAVNSGADETHASFSADGKVLFFTSARRGGYGGLDIYRSDRLDAGEWGEAVNLGPVINTESDEETPFLSDDGRQLFFSSKGHFNMGGFDIFFSRLSKEGYWKDPINIGYPINNTTDDLFFYPIGDGSQAYYSRIERVGPHAFNIFRLSIGERTLEFSDRPGFPEDFRLNLIHNESSDTIIIDYIKDQNMFKSTDPDYRISIDDPAFRK
jgi:hypothetical protein